MHAIQTKGGSISFDDPLVVLNPVPTKTSYVLILSAFYSRLMYRLQMKTITLPLLATLLGLFRSRTRLHLEVLSLRQQLAMAKQKPHKRHQFNRRQRFFWICLYRLWPECLQTLQIFKPDPLIRWHQKGFKRYWRWKSRNYHVGRPKISSEVHELIRTMSQENMGWGAPRIHGELKMLGIEISQATVAKYLVKHRKPPSQTWRSFLNNHRKDLVSIDFFTVPNGSMDGTANG